MEKLVAFVREHIKEFWGGCFAGGIAGGSYLFPAPVLLKSYLIAFGFKIIATGLLAGISGLFTALFVDFYKHKIKPKLFKK